MLPDEEILRIVQGAAGLEQACNDLVATAKSGGGEDNITCLLGADPGPSVVSQYLEEVVFWRAAMAKLYLRFEQSEQVLKELPLTQAATTIGRLPDNTLQIDNLAVSGHHARITWEQDRYIVEELGSLNGTYVNDERVGKATLKQARRPSENR